MNTIVLLAVHNGARWLDEQISSILSQRAVSLRLFISDDRSKDSSSEICQRWSRADPRVILLPPPPSRGCTSNFFHLIRSVPLQPDTYLALADQDDIWPPLKLKRAITQLRQQSAHGYSANVTALWPSGRRSLIRKNHPQRKADFLFESPGPGCTFVLAPALAQPLQTFLLQHPSLEHQVPIHDWFIYAWARSRHYSWLIDSRPALLYRQHDRNVLGVNQGIKAHLARLKSALLGPTVTRMVRQAQLLYPDGNLPVPLHGTRISWLRLLFHISHCRRRPRDRWLLACLLLLLAIAPGQPKSDNAV
ncbi:glycosyltransferase [Pseudomonadota bacterium 24LQ007]